MEGNPTYVEDKMKLSQFSFQPPVPLDDKYVAKRQNIRDNIGNGIGNVSFVYVIFLCFLLNNNSAFLGVTTQKLGQPPFQNK